MSPMTSSPLGGELVEREREREGGRSDRDVLEEIVYSGNYKRYVRVFIGIQ